MVLKEHNVAPKPTFEAPTATVAEPKKYQYGFINFETEANAL